ncbi:unnamed protein product [Discosporangium mesarthrocarpum]
MDDYVHVGPEALDLSDLIRKVADPSAGAISTFSGTTRDYHNGKKVVRLEYEGYVPMAERELRKICTREKWDIVRVAVAHKLGVTGVGEASVIIAVSSVHRKESLAAVQYVIDTLKATVPVWKLEVYEGDSRVWKENAEWSGGGCCRKMVPVEDSDAALVGGAGAREGAEGCGQREAAALHGHTHIHNSGHACSEDS